MRIFYRISDGSYQKEKFKGATKKACLENFLLHFPKEEIILFADNVTDETFNWLQSYGVEVRRTYGGSSAAGFRIVFEEALTLSDTEAVYFVEDDYLHLPTSRTILLEGLTRAHYVTLYDHIDKYMLPVDGGNPLIGEERGEFTVVFLTENSHWKLTNSTTMTFATTVATLRQDADIWKKYTSGNHPHDFECFIALRESGRTLASPIPGLSTHCEPRWAAPLTDWQSLL
jgi:hypothetical protein